MSAYNISADDPRLRPESTLGGNSTQTVHSALIIQSVEKEDYSRLYCCVFVNELGRGERCIAVKGGLAMRCTG